MKGIFFSRVGEEENWGSTSTFPLGCLILVCVLKSFKKAANRVQGLGRCCFSRFCCTPRSRKSVTLTKGRSTSSSSTTRACGLAGSPETEKRPEKATHQTNILYLVLLLLEKKHQAQIRRLTIPLLLACRDTNSNEKRKKGENQTSTGARATTRWGAEAFSAGLWSSALGASR